MKKCLLIFVILALVATGAFAQFSLSVGGGVLFDGSFNNGIKIDASGFKGSAGWHNFSFGGFAFFDATYVEADISFAFGILKGYDRDDLSGMKLGDPTAIQLGFTVLGKYPFELGSITLFPLLGINYNVVLNGWLDGESFNDSGQSAAEWLSQFGFLGGVGLDYDITDFLYLRGEALFQIRLPMKEFREAASGPLKATVGLGPVIKVAVGYKF